MRRIELTGAFRRDFKREKRGHHRRDIDSLVSDAVSLLYRKPDREVLQLVRMGSHSELFG
jgi:mRNA-degrading endonuclease YafQ of YafQ-DinJ toxin-antitoxin module